MLVRAVLCLLSRAVSESISVLYSPATPFNVSTLVLPQRWELKLHAVSRIEELLQTEGDVAVDYLYSEELSSVACRTRDRGQYYRMWGVESSAAYIRDFSAYIQAIHLSDVYLVGDTTTAALIGKLHSEFPWLYSDFAVLPQDFDVNFALQFVGRHIKPRGLHFIAFFLSPQATYCFLQALQAKHLNKAGHVYVLSQHSGRFRYLSNSASGLLGNGVLVVGEAADIETSIDSLEARRINTVLTNTSLPQFVLFYSQSGLLVEAASRPADICNSTSILFPGNTTEFPSLSQATIRASVNYQAIDPDGSIHPLSALISRGVKIAFEEANSRTDLLPFYRLEDHSVGFTGLHFNFNFSLSRVQAALDTLGLIYMAPPVSQAIMGMTQVFEALNVSMPITSASMGSALSDPKEYPFFVRTRPSGKYIFSIVARMIRYFGWSKVAFLYAADGGDGEDAYRQFVAVKDDFGINITNPEALRALPAVLSAHTAAQVNTSLQAIIQSTTRIVIIHHDYQYILMEQLYDLGIREEYVQIYVSHLNEALFQGSQSHKRAVVSKGALLFYPRLFVGAVGRRVKQELVRRDGLGLYPNTCLYYDFAYLYFYATDYLVQSGYDYEDAREIMKAMRGTYFHGCSGFVRIEKGMNDRTASEITITNFQYSTDTHSMKQIGSFNPFSIQPYQIACPIQWPDDMPSYADTKPDYQACPFLAETVRELPYGGAVGAAFGVFLCVYTLVAALCICKTKRKPKYPLLKLKSYISNEDFQTLSTTLLDYIQFAVLGQNLKFLSLSLEKMCLGLSMDIARFPAVTAETYWAMLNVVLGMVYSWVVICICGLLGWKWVLGCEMLKFWAEGLMPTVLFIPITSALISVFQCAKGVSERLIDSFLDKDCEKFCWRNQHLGYAVACGLGLVLYIPLAVLARARWQEDRVDLHVKTRIEAIVGKAILQVCLVVAASSLKQTVGIYVHLGALLLYLLCMLLVRQHNYARFNLWEALLTVALLSLLLTAHISQFLTPPLSKYLLLILLGEYLLLFTIGLFLQTCIPRFASKLVRQHSKDVRSLFRFAFTFGRTAHLALQQFYAGNPTEVTSEQAIVIQISHSEL